MTTTVVYGLASDTYLVDSSSSYSTALSGPSPTIIDDTTTIMFFGQRRESGVYTIWQAFVAFDYTAPDATPVSAWIRLRHSSATGTGVARNAELHTEAWGATVDTSDWQTPAGLSGTLAAAVDGVQQAGSAAMRAGLLDITTVDSSSILRYALVSSRNRTQSAPSGEEYDAVRAADYSGTASDPALVVTATTPHRLDLSLGAQTQLSDGTHVLIAFDDLAPLPTGAQILHHDGTTTTVIDTFSPPERRGAQAYSLCRDADDNFYVVNRAAATGVNARAFVKGAGHTWTAGTLRNVSLPAHTGGLVNNVTSVWHPQGGSAGTVLAVAAREAGRDGGTPIAYALISCDHLLTGTGSLTRGVGDAEDTLVVRTSATGYSNPPNETGTLLDAAAVEGSDYGYVTCTTRLQELGANGAQSVCRYRLNSVGGGFVSTWRERDTTAGYSTKDADAKTRTLAISTSQWVTVTASATPGVGITVRHRQISNGDMITLASVGLDGEELATMPPAATLAVSPAWDAIYNPLDNRVTVYYLDTGDPRRVMKTHVDLSTGLAAGDEQEVNATIGATGAEVRAIRADRSHLEGDRVLITCAVEDSGTHTLAYVADTLNVAPTPPGLTAMDNFDATTAAAFAWEFNDPNPGDSQSSFRLQIEDVATSTVQHDTTKTASAAETYELAGGTLANGEDYRWRVMTWDAVDEPSPWSPWGGFATSASGNVAIIDPATDNEPLDTADAVVEWEVTGATQEEYRVVVVRTSDEATHSDTGWVVSTDVTHLVTGLASETEYRVEVTIRDTGVDSSTGTRLLTPDYTSPMAPVVTATGVPDGAYILITVDNPTPGEEAGTLDGGFESGIEGWTTGVPEVVGSSTDLVFGGTATVTVPSGTADGDLMVLWLCANFDNAHTPPSGWTLPSAAHDVAVDGHGATLYTRTAASEPASYGVVWDDPDNWHSASLIVVRGAAGLDGWASDTASSATSLTCPSVTARDGDLVLALGHTVTSGTRTLPGEVTVVADDGRAGILGHDLRTADGATGGYLLENSGSANGMIAASQTLTSSAVVAQSDTQANTGSFSAEVTASGTPALAGIHPEAEHRAAVVPNQRYTVSFAAYSPAGHSDLRAAISFYDGSDALIATESTTAPIAAATWEVHTSTHTAPPGAATAGYGPALVDPPDAMTLYVDDVELRTASDVPEPARNELLRAHGGGQAEVIADVPPDGQHRDYNVASAVTYTYTARAHTD